MSTTQTTPEITAIAAFFDGDEDFNISAADIFGTDANQIATELLIGTRDFAAENGTEAPKTCRVEIEFSDGTTAEATVTTTDELIACALVDAAEVAAKHGEVRIYVDPNCGGYAWMADEEDYISSGGIGYDAELYGDRFDTEDDAYAVRMDAVRRALVAAGFEVTK